jgi:cell division topological specificity factor
VIDFFNKFFRPAPPSGATAKERLRLVLLSDHLSLAPDVVESLKRDLLAVISRYVEIDPAHADVTFERRDHDVAMLASIPITGVRRPGADEAPEPTPTPPPTPRPVRYDARPAVEPAPGAIAVAEKPQSPPDSVSLELPMAAEAVSAPVASVSSDAAPKSAATSAAHRRRRRRRKANAAAKRGAQTQNDPPLNASAQA